MGKSTISIAIFNSYFDITRGYHGFMQIFSGIQSYNPTHRIHGAGIYANIGGILMGSMLPYIAYMDPTSIIL